MSEATQMKLSIVILCILLVFVSLRLLHCERSEYPKLYSKIEHSGSYQYIYGDVPGKNKLSEYQFVGTDKVYLRQVNNCIGYQACELIELSKKEFLKYKEMFKEHQSSREKLSESYAPGEYVSIADCALGDTKCNMALDYYLSNQGNGNTK